MALSRVKKVIIISIPIFILSNVVGNLIDAFVCGEGIIRSYEYQTKDGKFGFSLYPSKGGGAFSHGDSI
ncbi:hypothetical protein GCM10023163_02200 [Aestuariibaculum suncheonense]